MTAATAEAVATAGTDDASPAEGSNPGEGSNRQPSVVERRPSLEPSLVILVVGVAAAAVVRFLVVSDIDGPATVDAGNWLAFGHDLLGEPVRSSSIAYPPLVPLLTVAVTEVLGLAAGIAALVAVGSVLPAIGTGWVLRRAGLRWMAAWGAIVLAWSSAAGEAAAWGGFPQLIGLGLMGPMLWTLVRWLRDPGGSGGPGGRWPPIVIWLVIAAASHFIAAVAAIAAVATVVIVALVDRALVDRALVDRALVDRAPFDGAPFDGAPVDGRGGQTAPRVLGLWPAAIGSLLLAPWYLKLLAAGGGPARIGFVDPLVVDGFRYALRDLPLLWYPAVAIGLLGPWAVRDRRREPLWIVTTAVVVSTIAAALLLADTRVGYLMGPAAVLGVALVAGSFDRSLAGHAGSDLPRLGFVRVACAVLLVAGAAGVVRGSTPRFEDQVRHYAVAADLHEALDWIRDSSPPGSLVAVPAVRDAPVGWWVEGYSRRPALVGSPHTWLHFPDERERASAAGEVLGPGFPTEAQVRAAADHGVDLLLIPDNWAEKDEASLMANLDEGVLELCSSGGGARVLALGRTGCGER